MGRGLRICLTSYRHRCHADGGAAAKGPGSFPHGARIHRAWCIMGFPRAHEPRGGGRIKKER
jgi:hypothetical protein